jgi:riboflavin kinase/FMN adenylyltransferase
VKVYTNIQDFKNVNNPIVTTGTFDGVHVGHRKIISRLKEIAAKEHGETVMLTFFPHPRMVLFPEHNGLQLINTQQEKIDLMERAGVDHLIIYPFTKEFSRLTATEYIRDLLVNTIGLKKLVIGYDHQFGRNREGNLEHLQEVAPMYGFEIEEIPAQDIDDVKISSTKIRKALSEGNIDIANQYLGYEFMLSGLVIPGNKLGRTIGFPTANLQVTEKNKVIPANGVYAVKVRLKDETYQGMLNIGLRPTVNGGNEKQSIEVHIFNFHREIYDEVVTLAICKRIRNEIKFDNVEQLKAQLEQDRIRSLNILD